MLNSEQNSVEMAGVFWPAGTKVINTLLFLQVAQHSCFYAGTGSGDGGLPSLDCRLCSMVDPLVSAVVVA